jgi:hypothetical protein
VRTLGSADEVLEQMWRWPPSMPTSFHSIAAVAAVTAGASVTSINGVMPWSTKRRLEALERKRREPDEAATATTTPAQPNQNARAVMVMASASLSSPIRASWRRMLRLPIPV